jgi:tetratricopeptide (TPR) repeat protein
MEKGNRYSYDEVIQCESLGDYKKAIEILIYLYNQDPSDTIIILKIAFTSIRINDWKTFTKFALLYLNVDAEKRVLNDNRSLWTIYHHLGVAFALNKDYHQAIPYFQKAIEFENNSDTFLYMGECYMSIGNINEGISIWKTSGKMGNGKAILALNSRAIDL